MDAKVQLADKLKAAANILVTVSNNPSVDQLAGCIGMTLWLNKLGKHATAVFSGAIPNTLEFLQPESTLEKDTNSLRDFIIALDKSKADKLRYKVEDRVVKIFITPYRTSLSANDLEFSQGDFNVDAIVAIGVTKQEDLDQAIVSHGRILHDAVVATINTTENGDIGSINFKDTSASSLSELVYDVCQMIDPKQLDPQIATALLTGIVAETNRFSNEKTNQNTMSVAAALMGAGANQQLVATKLEGSAAAAKPKAKGAKKDNKAEEKPKEQPQKEDGTLEIDHSENPVSSQPQPIKQEDTNKTENESTSIRMMTEPPSLRGTLTANSRPDDEDLEPITDPLSLPPVDTSQLLNREPLTPIANEPPQPNIPQEQPPAGPAPKEEPDSGQTLAAIEQAVESPHIQAFKDQVSQVIGTTPAQPTELAPPAAPSIPPVSPTPPLISPAVTQEPANPLEFNPANFDIPPEENAPPQVPPPIVPPNFLPPEPPQ